MVKLNKKCIKNTLQMTIKRWRIFNILTILSVNLRLVFRRKMTYGLNFIKDALKKQFLIFIIFQRFNQGNLLNSQVSMILMPIKTKMKKKKWPKDLVKASNILRKCIQKTTMERASISLIIFVKDCCIKPSTQIGLTNKLTILIQFSMPSVKLSK